jgi:branched-chain amino acid transport system permease protein
MGQLGNIAIDGIAYGMILFVTSVGLTVTLGLMRLINLTHGAFAVAGGYAAAWLIDRKVGFGSAVLIALLLIAVVGVVVERGLVRRFYGATELTQVILTIGLCFLSIATINAMAGPAVRLLHLPSWLAQPVDLGFRIIPAHRLFVIGTGLVVLAAVTLLSHRTLFGVWLRATVDDKETAASLGIPISRVYAITFSAGCALAALGGILGAEILPLEPFYPVKYLVLVLVVVAVGGAGSVAGTAVAAIGLGLIETAGKYWASDWASVMFFAAAATSLVLRPRGILQER